MGKRGRKEPERVREKRPEKRRVSRKDERELLDISTSLNYDTVG